MFTLNGGTYLGFSAGQSKSRMDNTRITQDVAGSGVVIDNLSENNRDSGYKAYIGMPFNPNWAVEAGYFDLGRFDFAANTTPAGSLTSTSRVRGLNLDLVGTLPMTERWSLMGRVGAAYAQTHANFSSTGAVSVIDPSPTKRETNYKYGLGAQYAFTPALTLRLDAERYQVNNAVGQRGDVDLLSLGLVYRFGGPMAPTRTGYTSLSEPEPVPMLVEQALVPVAPPP